MNSRREWLIVGVAAVLPLLGWWAYGLLDLDEGFYGAVTAEMNRRGEWITPFFNGQPWFEKPILLYWLAKPAMAWFGMAVGPRLPSVLATIGTYAVCAWFARRHFGGKIARLAVLILAGSVLVVAVGRMMLTDPLLVLCLSGALITFWESLVGDRRWRLATAALLGFGILAKGPVAALLFLLVAGWTFWREPELRPRFRGGWLAGTALLALIVAIWYVPAYLVDGRLFVDEFLIEQNIGRFTGGDAAHSLGPASLPFYIPILLVGMAPWSFYLFGAWPRRGDSTASSAETAPLKRYLATWAGVVFVFFSLSGAKLPHYVLPAILPLALLVAVYLSDRRWGFWVAAGMCALMAVLANAGFIFWYHASGEAEAQGLIRYVGRQGGDVALYALGRQGKARATGSLKLQETDLPSLLMYLDRNAIDTGNFSVLLAHPGPLWIFTRAGRIGLPESIAAARAGRRLVAIEPTVKTDNFGLYELR